MPIETASGTIDSDECVRGDITQEKLASLPPAFAELGAAGTDEEKDKIRSLMDAAKNLGIR